VKPAAFPEAHVADAGSDEKEAHAVGQARFDVRQSFGREKVWTTGESARWKKIRSSADITITGEFGGPLFTLSEHRRELPKEEQRTLAYIRADCRSATVDRAGEERDRSAPPSRELLPR